jgi:plasmid stabilization system protein ParE
MLYEVSLTKDAERDLEEIYIYIAERDSPASCSRRRRTAVVAAGRCPGRCLSG